MNSILDLIRTEPTVVWGSIGGIVDAGIVLAVDFGAHIQPSQVLGIDGLIAAVGGFITLLVIRSQVTPNAKVAPADQKIVVDVPAPPTPIVPPAPLVPPVPPAPGA
jgi:hypothetical protein